MIIETERLILRKITKDDFTELEKMLKDIDVMYAWEHSFSDEQINLWIEKRIKGYTENGYDYLLAIEKSSNKVVGQMGLVQENIDGKNVIGLGWILNKAFWKQGFALEGAKALIEYAFNVLKKDTIIAKIRTNNLSSIKVAERLGMKKSSETIVNYNGKDMPHCIFTLNKGNSSLH